MEKIVINNWWTPATTQIEEYVVSIWSPDFRSNDVEAYVVTAPNSEWAMAQVIAVAMSGDIIEPDDVLSGGESLAPLDDIPDNLTMTVNGRPVPDYKSLIKRMLHRDHGLA